MNRCVQSCRLDDRSLVFDYSKETGVENREDGAIKYKDRIHMMVESARLEVLMRLTNHNDNKYFIKSVDLLTKKIAAYIERTICEQKLYSIDKEGGNYLGRLNIVAEIYNKATDTDYIFGIDVKSQDAGDVYLEIASEEANNNQSEEVIEAEKAA